MQLTAVIYKPARDYSCKMFLLLSGDGRQLANQDNSIHYFTLVVFTVNIATYNFNLQHNKR
jgi:hypothetical protein